METGKNFEETEPEKKIKTEKLERASMQDIEIERQGEADAKTEESPEKTEAEISELKQNLDKLYKTEISQDSKDVSDREQYATEEKDPSVGMIKSMGIRVGEFLGGINSILRKRVNKFEVEYSGAEHLKKLEEKPYLLAANHIKPKNILMQAMGLSPDSFLLKRIIEEETQRTPNAIANISGKIKKIPIIGQLDRIWSPFREGMMEGMGFIPVKMRRGGKPGGFNRNFVQKFRDAVEKKEPVIIFPQGRWDKEFDSRWEFETGTGHLAKKYNLPIVPAYIKGGRSWSSKEKASVSFGEAISPDDKTKEEITAEIKESIIRLKEEEIENNELKSFDQ